MRSSVISGGDIIPCASMLKSNRLPGSLNRLGSPSVTGLIAIVKCSSTGHPPARAHEGSRLALLMVRKVPVLGETVIASRRPFGRCMASGGEEHSSPKNSTDTSPETSPEASPEHSSSDSKAEVPQPPATQAAEGQTGEPQQKDAKKKKEGDPKPPSLLLSDLYTPPKRGPLGISMRELTGLLTLLVEYGGKYGTAAVALGYFLHVDPFGSFHW